MLEAQKPIVSKVVSVEKFLDNILIQTENGKIVIQIFAPKIVRIVYTLKNKVDFKQGDAFINNNVSQNVKWDYVENEDYILVKTTELIIKVLKETGAISYFDKNNNCLLKEKKNNSKELIPFELFKTVIDETSEVKRVKTPDGIKEIVVDSKKVFDKTSYHSRVNFEFSNEAIYGSGQHEEGELNLRGTRVYLHQSNLKIAIPMFVSTKGYGLLFDNYSPSIFNDNSFGSYVYCEASQQLDYYFIGGDISEVINGYREMTGKATLLPIWFFGFIQSLERYEDRDEIINTVKEYRKRNVPLDCIVLDWQSWEGELWGQKAFDKERFDKPEEMIKTLHELNSKFMISIWPNMVRESDNYKEMEEARLTLPQSEIYNAYSQKGRELYWKQAYEGLYKYGVDAWWCDSSEPFTPEWNEIVKPEPDQNYIKFRDTLSTYTDQELSNSYALYHAKGIFEGQKDCKDGKRVVNLTRSGYIGQQKYGVILWSGDVSATWDTLKKQIAAGLNLSVTGLPYWTFDIGAFFTKNGEPWFWNGDFELGNKDMGYRELYTRWYQMGAFLPIFRSHGTDTRREIWNFGDEGDVFYDTIKNFTELRYKLIPYIYSLAGSVYLNNETMLRLLAFDFIDDNKVYNIDDQFMFGKSIMVCPVYTPMYYGVNSELLEDVKKERNVYLPNGTLWYDFWTNEKYVGGKEIVADAEIEKLPIFIKGGSIIPTYKKIQSTSEIDNKSFDINVYTGFDTEFDLYLDDGDNYNYENGEYAVISLKWRESQKTFIIEDCVGSYSKLPKSITFNLKFIGEELSDRKIEYNLSKKEVVNV